MIQLSIEQAETISQYLSKYANAIDNEMAHSNSANRNYYIERTSDMEQVESFRDMLDTMIGELE